MCLGALGSCDVGHAFLLTNDTTGVNLTYTNTHDCDVDNVTFVGRHLPSQLICGERNDRCGMSSISNSNGSILVIAFPLDGGLGLVSYQFENSSYFFREKQFVTQSIADCTIAFFVPYPLRSNDFIGYCLDLSGHMIRHVFVEIVIEMLANSRVYSNNFYGPFDIQSNSFLSNFLNIVNIECFTTDNGHVVFLHNSNLLDHSLDDAAYMSHGSIGVEACSMSEPRLQRLGSECKLAAYCNGTTAIFGTPEDFTSSGQVVDRLATETDELAFVCSSSYYILFRNKTLSVREISSGNQIGNSFPFDTESILLGDCLVSQQQFFFVAALSNNSKFFVNFSARSSYSLAESGNYTTPTPYLVQDKLLFVNNGTHTLIWNWTRMREDDFLSLPINFDFVLSLHTFGDGLCSCAFVPNLDITQSDSTSTQPETTTNPANSTSTQPETATNPANSTSIQPETTTNPANSTSTQPGTTTNPANSTSIQPGTTTNPANEISVGLIIGVSIGVALIIIVIIVIIVLIWILRKQVQNSLHVSGP